MFIYTHIHIYIYTHITYRSGACGWTAPEGRNPHASDNCVIMSTRQEFIHHRQ